MKNIFIPIGKALIIVEEEKPINKETAIYADAKGHKSLCDKCFFNQYFTNETCSPCKHFICANKDKDSKTGFYYKLVDYKENK